MKPSIGRIVLFHGFDSNGSKEHPAIITRVWTDTCVNLSVFADYGGLTLKSSAIQDEEMKQDFGWRWPPRV